MAKTRRLLELIEVVKQKRQFTVQELADEFHVSYRTMLRDLQEISTLGIPLYSEQGNKGGYRLLDLSGYQNQVEIIKQNQATYLGYFFTAPYTARKETEILVPRLWIKLLQTLSDADFPVQSLKRTALSQYRKNDFTYLVTVEVESVDMIPNGMTALCIPARQYARKTHNHILDVDKVINTYDEVIQWTTTNGWVHEKSAFHLEIFDERFQPKAPQANFDVLIPIIKS